MSESPVDEAISGVLAPPFRKEGDHGWLVDLPAEAQLLTDNNEEPRKSRLRLFEDGKPLGPAHSAHATIMKAGRGAYSFWRTGVYFSSSDYTDPNHNGRTYSFKWVEPEAVSTPLTSRGAPVWEPPTKSLRCAILGAGNRGVGLGILAARFVGVEIAWVVDKSPDRVAEACRTFGDQARGSLDCREPIADPTVDFVIVAVPDYLHAAVTVPAFRAGKHVFLEKPLATNVEDARSILAAWQQSGKVLQLGYVLRQAPFYAAIKSVVERGLLGDVRVAMLSEQLDVRHGASFMRRWHANSSASGGLMVHKGSHDLDILCWLLNSHAVRVSSFGGSSTFAADPPARYCSECDRRAACPWADNALHEWRTPEESRNPSAHGLDSCVFRKDKDIVDNQVVAFELANGTRGSFQLAMQGPVRSERRISLIGDKGTLDGIFEDGCFTVKFTAEDKPLLAWSAADDVAEGHGGGDKITMVDFLNACTGRRSSPVSAVYDAVRGLVFAEAAERARLTNTIVQLAAADSALASSATWMGGQVKPNQPQKFVVISQQRCGSHMLMNLLNSHPELHCHSDLATDDIRRYGPEWAFQRGFSLPPDKTDAKFVGFLVKMKQDLQEVIAARDDIAVILLRRKNRFASFISQKMADELGCYEKPERGITLENARETRTSMAPLVVSSAEAEQFFLDREREEIAVRDVLKDRSLCEVTYEEIVGVERAQAFTRIYQFLNIDWQSPAHTAGRGAEKLDSRPLRKAVANYDEIQAHFIGTRWATYFAGS